MNVKIDEPSFMDPRLPLKRPTLPADFGVGSPVLVIEPSHRRVQSDPVNAVVTDKARMWIDVKTDGSQRRNHVYRLRLDDQTDGSGSHYAYRFRTPQQHAWEQARDAALRYLGEQGVRLDLSSPWRKNPVPLARAIYQSSGSNQEDAS